MPEVPNTSETWAIVKEELEVINWCIVVNSGTVAMLCNIIVLGLDFESVCLPVWA